jgi:hypothetical protein
MASSDKIATHLPCSRVFWKCKGFIVSRLCRVNLVDEHVEIRYIGVIPSEIRMAWLHAVVVRFLDVLRCCTWLRLRWMVQSWPVGWSLFLGDCCSAFCYSGWLRFCFSGCYCLLLFSWKLPSTIGCWSVLVHLVPALGFFLAFRGGGDYVGFGEKPIHLKSLEAAPPLLCLFFFSSQTCPVYHLVILRMYIALFFMNDRATAFFQKKK